jgi:hypothetical protein
MVVGLWLEIKAASDSSECILALGDNTSAIGWLFPSGRVDQNSLSYAAIQQVARHLATLILDSDHCLASQHLKGEKNIMADLLSYTGSTRGHAHPLAANEPSDEVVTHRFHIFLPSQIPRSFEISALPSEVLSWVTQILRIADLSLTPDTKTPTKSTIGSGDDGNPSAPKEESPITPTSLTCAVATKSFSFDLSSASTDKLAGMAKENLPETVKTQWLQALCRMPQAIWLRRSGNVTGPAPCTSRAATTCSPTSAPYSRRTTMSTPPLSGKKPLPPNCCESCSTPAGPERPDYATQPQPLPQTSSLAPFSLPNEVASTQPPPPKPGKTKIIVLKGLFPISHQSRPRPPR